MDNHLDFPSVLRYYTVNRKNLQLMGGGALSIFKFTLSNRSPNMLNLGQINRILIIRLAPLGETVLTTPVIRALRQHFRDAYITYMVAPT